MIIIQNAHDLKNCIGCGEVINNSTWKGYMKDFEKAVNFFRRNPDNNVFFDWHENDGKGLIIIDKY